MRRTRLAGNAGRKKLPKIRHLGTIAQFCRNHNMVNFGPLGAEIVSLVWGTQQISTGFASWRHYRTDFAHQRPTKLCTMFGRFLGWYTIYIYILGGCCPLRDFASCKIHFASKSCTLLYWQRYCTALAVGIIQTLQRGTRSGIAELSQDGATCIWKSDHHVGHRPTF